MASQPAAAAGQEAVAIDSLGQVHYVAVIDTTKPTPAQPTTLALTDEQRTLIERASNICQVSEYHDTANQLRALLDAH
jgi:hypothetical protein